tara:strand:- start:771 stop:995 length:225 start_codon:yes stop_codon:yes gene_type:complete
MKKKAPKTSTIIATYETDLSLVINWLKLNRAISSSGPIYEMKNGSYGVKVKNKKSKSDIKDLVLDRFGSFARVK